jgi:putative tryptophan/tyrosine transport system substrate-binding protein
VSVFTTPAMWGKRLDFVRALLPKATNVAMLLSPNDPTEPDINELRSQAHALGLELFSVTAATVPEIDSAFANAVQQGANALLVSDKPFFTVRRELIVPLAARHALPAIYAWHDYVMAGGLMSYGSSLSDAWRQVGIYTARILKGAKPSDLPVQQPTKFYLAINLKTEKMLGLTVPPTLLTIADEVIE